MSVVPVPVFPVSGTVRREFRNARYHRRKSIPVPALPRDGAGTEKRPKNRPNLDLPAFPILRIFPRVGDDAREAQSRVLPLASAMISSYSFRNSHPHNVAGSQMARPRLHACVADDCLRLYASDFDAHHWSARAPSRGTVQWHLSTDGKVIAAVAYEYRPEAGSRGAIMLRYRTADSTGEEAELTIPLIVTRPYFGGLRYWFACPGDTPDGACGNRVRALYLPPGETKFACRNCHDLTYASSRMSHAFDRLSAPRSPRGRRAIPSPAR
jgi:hypothetical protein